VYGAREVCAVRAIESQGYSEIHQRLVVFSLDREETSSLALKCAT
jgi:hypothetical protein